MTTNKPEVLGFFVEWSCNNEEGEFKLSLDHFTTRDDYCSIFGSDCRLVPVIRLSDYEALKAECESLRREAEFGRSVLSKREPGEMYGCHCDLDEGMEPDGCVIDSGERHNCIYAKDISVKEQCEYWRVIASDATHRKQGGE